MSHTFRRIRSGALAAAALLFLTVAATPGTAQALATAPVDARSMDAAATSLSLTSAELASAASELELGAALREADDPTRGEELRLAGRYYHHAGELEKARAVLVAAGRAFYAAGDHRSAAHTFVDASQVADEAGNSMGAWSAAHLAGAVLREGELDAKERDAVLARVKVVDREYSLLERGPGS